MQVCTVLLAIGLVVGSSAPQQATPGSHELPGEAPVAAEDPQARRALAGYVVDDTTIRTAVNAWFDDQSGATATYGHISTWDTTDVTDMSCLFAVGGDCGRVGDTHNNAKAEFFNEDLSAWNTTSVTSMERMFWMAYDFDQPIGATPCLFGFAAPAAPAIPELPLAALAPVAASR